MQQSRFRILCAGLLLSLFGACASPPKAAPDREGTSSSAAIGVKPTTDQVVNCTKTAERSKVHSGPQVVSTPARELAKLKAKVMTADYQGNLEELARVREELSPWRRDRELAYLAYYWSGFASWRTAINGANHQMKVHELTANLKNAAADFYSAMRLKDDFADAYAAGSLVNGWLATIVDPQERLSLARALSARATALEPENPRVLWMTGPFFSTRQSPREEAFRARSRSTARCSRRLIERASTPTLVAGQLP